MPAAHTVRVLLDDGLATLNRAVGVLRRRNVPVGRLVVAPTGTAGVARLTFVLTADAATADRVVRQFQKIIGVHEVALGATESSTTEGER